MLLMVLVKEMMMRLVEVEMMNVIEILEYIHR
jgi:hypothetical protein